MKINIKIDEQRVIDVNKLLVDLHECCNNLTFEQKSGNICITAWMMELTPIARLGYLASHFKGRVSWISVEGRSDLMT